MEPYDGFTDFLDVTVSFDTLMKSFKISPCSHGITINIVWTISKAEEMLTVMDYIRQADANFSWLSWHTEINRKG